MAPFAWGDPLPAATIRRPGDLPCAGVGAVTEPVASRSS